MQTKTIKETDNQLRDAVLSQLEWDPQVISKDINVATADNVVTLTGFVHSYAEKYAAEKAAQAVYGVKALANDIEVTGRLIVKLWASSDALDTDFTAKLVDVYPPNADFPSGVDLNIADSIVRARYHDGFGKAELLKPGQPYEFTIEMYPTSLVFKRGHRIRLDISSSNFPRFDINPNTGEPLNNNRRSQVADNTIYLDAKHPSQIVLPVVPAETTETSARGSGSNGGR